MTDVQPNPQPDQTQDNDLDQAGTNPQTGQQPGQPQTGQGETSPGQRDQGPATGGEGAAGAGGPDGFGTGS